MLSWRPGRDVTAHKVYLGTDPNAVANGTAAAQTVIDHAFDPGTLAYATTYYWKVDEIGAAGTYPGYVWSFTTINDLGLGHSADMPVQAYAPQPANGAAGQSLTTTLSWRPDREGASHKVFFGTDPDAVTNGTATAKIVTDPAFDPGSLNYGTIYYWRVDEVGTVTYPGEVWSFTTQEFAVVDDFESYNNTDHRIYNSWIDGLTDGKSGSVVGYDTAPFAEQTIVHGGQQSMPLAYDNSKPPFYSEATRDFGAPQDWTGHGATHLDLWFRGYTGTGSWQAATAGMTTHNAPALLSLTVTDKAGKSKTVSNVTSVVAVMTADWTEWRIPLSDLTGVSLTTVQKITLRAGLKGGAGLLYFDDIGFGHPVK